MDQQSEFSVIFYEKEDVTDPEEKDRNVLLERGLRRTFDALKAHNKQVIFVMDNPDFSYDPNSCTERPFNLVTKSEDYYKKCNPSRKKLENNYIRIWYNGILKKVASDYDRTTQLRSVHFRKIT